MSDMDWVVFVACLVVAVLCNSIGLIFVQGSRVVKIKHALRWLVDLGRWRCVCPSCDPWGTCNHENAIRPHSCGCGDCQRIFMPRIMYPRDFDGVERVVDLHLRSHYPREVGDFPPGTSVALVGCGYVRGSFWQMLRVGWWSRSSFRRLRETRLCAVVALLKYGNQNDLLNWHEQIVEGKRCVRIRSDQ